ncbi:hypothetical protein ACFQ1L_19950 [Phytohabitans flavus]|uniref:hypothetical protein n=1 Tax=Phytohabitans flavus TaxID=1076124 RepID=UPI0015644033|nr:hypothetical protein [Phytohabitans flavus]
MRRQGAGPQRRRRPRLHGRRTCRPEYWLAEADGPGRDERTRNALAEAVAVVAYGRSTEGRRALARATAGEPGLSQPWLRTLVTRLANA